MVERLKLNSLVQSLYEAADNELEAERIAKDLISLGSDGVDLLGQTLENTSRSSPKLGVAILNAFNGRVSPHAEQVLSHAVDSGKLSEEDSTYVLIILSRESASPNVRKRLVARLRRTKDRIDRADVLAEIVRTNATDAIAVLADLVRQLDSEVLDYSGNPEDAARDDMARFALLALRGQQPDLRSIALDRTNHPLRRSTAMQVLALSLGEAALPILREAAFDHARQVRVGAMRSVEELPFTLALPMLEVGLRDEDSWVCIVAAGVLERYLEKADSSVDLDALATLLPILSDAQGRHVGDRTLVKVLQRISNRIIGLRRPATG